MSPPMSHVGSRRPTGGAVDVSGTGLPRSRYSGTCCPMVDAAKLAATSVVNVRRGIVYVMSRVGVGVRGDEIMESYARVS